jgi:hypothetical protein
MHLQMSLTEPLRAFAALHGFDENDPALVRAVEALRKLKRGELSPEEADATLDPLIETWIKKAGEETPHAVVIPSESNSFHAAPLREWARQAGIHDNDPLLVRALKAQEKADWRTNLASWQEMEISVLAFMQAHFEIKNAWPPESPRIEGFLQKLQKGNPTTTEIEEFRRLGREVLRDWQSEYSPAFKQRIESAMSLLDPKTGENSERK